MATRKRQLDPIEVIAQASNPAKKRNRARRVYRNLIDHTKQHRTELAQVTSDVPETLEQHLDTGKRVYNSIDTIMRTREVALDTEFMNLAGGIADERIRRLCRSQFSPSDFAIRLGQFLLKDTEANKGQNSMGLTQRVEDIDGNDVTTTQLKRNRKQIWPDFGAERVLRCFYRTPQINFMLGPLTIPPPSKKQRVFTARAKKAHERQAKQSHAIDMSRVVGGEDDCRRMGEALAKAGKPVPYLDFILHPDSFSRTVENAFVFSKLVKGERASVAVNKSFKEPIRQIAVEFVQEGHTVSNTSQTQTGAAYHSASFNINYDLWEYYKETIDREKVSKFPHTSNEVVVEEEEEEEEEQESE